MSECLCTLKTGGLKKITSAGNTASAAALQYISLSLKDRCFDVRNDS